ncbi:hypothetical protein VOLCADRAFT_99965 [Volvox carteri f. nagariensis]|uniref:Gem-associated protein 2 n=1 Tax=Volvox carteri f. nagariensis TaxID=3068 RepID=D8UJ36_VOLCA|nr:uncharacterized protein VOLCADRAFT_99965 [Volvox carteri f. nagariensis]EFJ40264.1 hypothetical protein VOLCADRAFT_99965 [Volvox carteri f. nagariensis]|eukprot:XP_002958661.1 hypothetical protein VOLCADRAFT_99965 [Volvox carteri f. nagariensis]
MDASRTARDGCNVLNEDDPGSADQGSQRGKHNAVDIPNVMGDLIIAAAADDDAEFDEDDEGEYEDEDEAMATSDDEDYNRTHFGIVQALPVPDGPLDMDAGPPQTAEEYLRWVRFEASQCPRITRKDIDPAVLQRQQQQQQGHEGGEDSTAIVTTGLENGGSRHAGCCPSGGAASSLLRSRVPPPVVSSCPEWARPCPNWLAAFLQDFSRLRRALSTMQRQHVKELSSTRLPSLENTAAWDRLCFEQWQPLEHQEQQQGQQEQQQQLDHQQQQQQQQLENQQQACCESVVTGDKSDNGAESPPPPPPPPSLPHEQQQGQQQQTQRHGGVVGGGGGGGGSSGLVVETDRLCGPVVRTVLALDQVSVGSLIQRHVGQLSTQPCLSYIRSQWLFALAAVLERPVPPDVAAALRELVRRCSAWRATLEHPDDPVLPRLNVLLAVAGGYFGQDEHLSAAAAAASLGDLI